jgi:hypothetical protein
LITDSLTIIGKDAEEAAMKDEGDSEEWRMENGEWTMENGGEPRT